MKSAIVTGVNGTLAPVLVAKLKQQGINVTAWDRHQVPPGDIDAVRYFLDKQKPNMLYHLAMGDAAWAKTLAIETARRNIKLLFTSTAMVFNHVPDGPHLVCHRRTALDDYGQGKIACEDVIMEFNPNAIIARIGWQIAWSEGGNNMFAHLVKTHDENGFICASETWFPACSLMTDTCEGLCRLIENGAQGVYQLDSNRHDKLSFAEIVQRINDKHALNWQIKVDESYVHDQRLPDERIEIPNISNHL